jgi:hypothetical protein
LTWSGATHRIVQRERTRSAIWVSILNKRRDEVCPGNIKITDNALMPMKERVLDGTKTRLCG